MISIVDESVLDNANSRIQFWGVSVDRPAMKCGNRRNYASHGEEL